MTKIEFETDFDSPGLYFGAFIASRELERIIRPMVIVIPDVETSVDYVTELCFDHFPPKDGWHDHRASLDKVPHDLVAKAALTEGIVNVMDMAGKNG